LFIESLRFVSVSFAGDGIVRIPLDYYRILGLPIQATAEQLQQAHRDRTQQLPRREFSEAAISARKQLIDQAYTLLSDAARRQEYDAGFLAKSYDLPDGDGIGAMARDGDMLNSREPDLEGVDPYTPSIELNELQFIGALLILLELGEYELVLRLGRPYLNSGNLSSGTQGLSNGKFGDPEIVSADVVLTVALAHLELGREQWQQGQYENAASSLEHGQELLLREGLFANIRGEMQSDLFKLRPYRILELVSLPDGQEDARRQGVSLLEDMLHDRGGIDGAGDDLSGLGVDDFLRFIQQLRSYLTSAEQQVLFEAEARRPSAVATYLAVYALLSRGFAQRQPALIRRAKMLLLRLGSHQDVHLEQAVCALLLGQTEEASRALELSQEFESLNFIRDHSQTSPDMLPGLCLYSERWFQNEVFPHFRDLQQKQASLTEYFADEDVQLYLEELPAEAESARPLTSSAYSTSRQDAVLSRPEGRPEVRLEERPEVSARQSLSPTKSQADLSQTALSQTSVGQTGQSGKSYTARTATIEEPQINHAGAASGMTTKPADSPEETRSSHSPNRESGGSDRNSDRVGRATRSSRSPQPSEDANNGNRPATRRVVPSNLRLDRILLLAALGLLGVMLLGFLFGKLLNRPQPRSADAGSTSVSSAGTGAGIGVGTAFSEFANSQEQTLSSQALTETNAPEIIQTWLEAKAAAMGEKHEIDKLAQILVDPALSQQQTRAEEMKAEDAYWKLEHPKVEIVSVESDQSSDPAAANSDSSDNSDDETAADSTDSNDPDSADENDAADSDSTDASDSANQDSSDRAATQEASTASVEAIVTEKAELYSQGQIDTSASYDSTVRVRYDLVRQDGQWRIQDMSVLE
jgi:curved DNA-binding protein CbpA